jgi:hypothetical protein
MNIKNNLHLEPVNCGYERGTPFCLAFLFTKTGTELYTGTFELIRSKLLKHSICHGIVHYYRGKAIFAKRWCVFGENAGSNRGEIALSQLPRKIRTPNFNPFDFSRLSRRYIDLFNTQMVEIMMFFKHIVECQVNICNIFET